MPARYTTAFIASLLASLLPTLLYVWLLWRLDRYEKEPARLLAAAFLWGAAPAVVLSVILELAFEAPLSALGSGYTQFLSSSIVTPPIEEILKGLALLGLARWARRDLDGLLDGVLYGAIVGLGFAMTENVFYFLGAWGEGDLSNWGMVVFTRAFAFGLNHAMYTAFTGAGVGIARHLESRAQRIAVVAAGLVLAIAAHAVHNGLLTAGDLCWFSLVADWGGVLVILLIVLLAWRRERELMRRHLTPEVASGLLSAQQYELIVSRSRRWKQTFRLLGVDDGDEARLWRNLVAAATELAFKLEQAQNDGDERLTLRLAALRDRIAACRSALGDLPAWATAPNDTPDEPVA
ncbi:MAG: PrsW family intramembrane metalloprotease [Chloroflexi bacterium]|nr:PrsW family intramembrane metalloprotease [Chloroflexota bacterium]